MNDLDLRAALHRDAELAGEPSPDLLDQLALRSDKQRRQRAGMLATALAVAVIAAGIPVGQSLLAQGDRSPADQAPLTTEPTTEPAPTPESTPTAEPTPTAAPEPPPAPPAPSGTVVVEPPQAAEVVVPGCPDQATLLEVVRSSGFASPGTLQLDGWETVCSEEWAFTTLLRDTGEVASDGERIAYPLPFLFRWDGAWTYVDRTGPCGAGEIPDDIWELTCNSG